MLGQLVRRLRAENRLPVSHGTVLGRLERDGPADHERPRRRRAHAPAVDGADASELEAAGLVDRTPDPTTGARFTSS